MTGKLTLPPHSAGQERAAGKPWAGTRGTTLAVKTWTVRGSHAVLWRPLVAGSAPHSPPPPPGQSPPLSARLPRGNYCWNLCFLSETWYECLQLILVKSSICAKHTWHFAVCFSAQYGSQRSDPVPPLLQTLLGPHPTQNKGPAIAMTCPLPLSSRN